MTCGGGLCVSAGGVKRQRGSGWVVGLGLIIVVRLAVVDTHLLGRLDGNCVFLRDGDLHGFGGVVLGG